MKVLLNILSLLIFFKCSFSSNPNARELQAFQKFKMDFRKQYRNSAAELNYFRKFIKAFRFIEKHNMDYDNGKKDFFLSINQFADLTIEELQSVINGTRLPPYEFTNFTIRPRNVITVTPDTFPPAPTSIDWRARGFVTPVKDQGTSCACCWAFAALASLESHLAIKTGIPLIASEQNLIDCNKNSDTGNFGCKGGNMAAAFMYILFQPGIASLESYPYDNIDNSDDFPCRYNRTTSIGTVTGYGRIRPNDEETLKRVVAAVGPVAFSFNSDPLTFLFYGGGIYNDPDCVSGTNHAALIYGYGSVRLRNGTNVEFWLCKNSWSVDWGDKGFFRIIRGRNMCGLTSYLIYPLV